MINRQPPRGPHSNTFRSVNLSLQTIPFNCEIVHYVTHPYASKRITFISILFYFILNQTENDKTGHQDFGVLVPGYSAIQV